MCWLRGTLLRSLVKFFAKKETNFFFLHEDEVRVECHLRIYGISFTVFPCKMNFLLLFRYKIYVFGKSCLVQVTEAKGNRKSRTFIFDILWYKLNDFFIMCEKFYGIKCNLIIPFSGRYLPVEN